MNKSNNHLLIYDQFFLEHIQEHNPEPQWTYSEEDASQVDRSAAVATQLPQ